MGEMSSWMSMSMPHYYRRMMQCIVDQIEHQVRVSWYAYQTLDDKELAVVMNVPRTANDGNKQRDLPDIGMSSNMPRSFVLCCHGSVAQQLMVLV